MHASVEFGQSAALWHGGPMLTVIVLVAAVPCPSYAVTATVCGPSPSGAGALNPYGWVISVWTSAPSTASSTRVMGASSLAVALTGKPAFTLAPCCGDVIKTIGGGGVPAPNSEVSVTNEFCVLPSFTQQEKTKPTKPQQTKPNG